MGIVEIRIATTDEDREAVYRLRYDLYVVEQNLFQREADHARRFLRDAYDAVSTLLLATIDGEPVGTFRLTFGGDTSFSPDIRETFQLDRFQGIVEERDMVVATRLLVRAQHRGGKIPFQLMWKAYETIARRNAEVMFADCEPHLANSYYRLGVRPYGGVYNHETNGALLRLMFIIGDLEFLRAIESPLLIAASQRTKPPVAVEALRAFLASEASVIAQSIEKERYWDEIARWVKDGGDEVQRLFNEFTREEAAVILAQGQIMSVEPGMGLIRRGHVSRTLYVLLSGSLVVEEGGVQLVEVTTPGSILGEVAFFTSGQRTSDVLGGPKGARVLALSDRVLREIIANHGPAAAKFLHAVARGLSQKLVERAARG